MGPRKWGGKICQTAGTGRHILAARAINPSTQQAGLLLSATQYLADLDRGGQCLYTFDANALPNGTPSTHFYMEGLHIGMSSTALLIAANMYAFADDSFQYAKIWVIDKASVYNAFERNCPHGDVSYYLWNLQNADGTTASSVVP